MVIDTRYFGEIDLTEDKIIHFEAGLFGFEEYKDFTILYDSEGEGVPFFSWLQSTKEKNLAFPIVNPSNVRADFDPTVEDGLLEPIGEIQEGDLVVLVLATVPSNVREASVNLKAPLIINAGTKKGVQLIVENQDYSIKHRIFPEIQE